MKEKNDPYNEVVERSNNQVKKWNEIVKPIKEQEELFRKRERLKDLLEMRFYIKNLKKKD